MPAMLVDLHSPRERSTNTPLVLIHDGGGTIFEYYMLGPLHRRTHAIANPYFDAGGSPPSGGIQQLAKEYAQAIQEHITGGPVLIGGWSLGGMISLEVARLLHGHASIKVIGLLFVDTMCPWSEYFRTHVGAILARRPNFRSTTPEHIKAKINGNFDAARAMIGSWEQPSTTFSPLKAVLIRASEAVEPDKVSDSSEASTIANNTLGWSEYAPLDIVSVIEAPGNHFSMFADDRSEGITDRISQACTTLEGGFKA